MPCEQCGIVDEDYTCSSTDCKYYSVVSLCAECAEDCGYTCLECSLPLALLSDKDCLEEVEDFTSERDDAWMGNHD